MGQAKAVLAKVVGDVAPGLFYYLADKAKRHDLTVQTTRDAISVIDKKTLRIVRVARENNIYLLDIINDFEYYFSSVEPVQMRSDGKTYSLVDFSTPRLHNVHGFDEFPVMFSSLAEPFQTCQQYLDFAQLSFGETVIDLGAYSALTSIAFANAVGPTGRVVAFEPDPLNRQAATINLAARKRRTGLDNITLDSSAVSGTAGTLTFSAEGAMGSSFTTFVGNHRRETVQVQAITLDDVVKKFGLTRVDFIKMDIEGADRDVITKSGGFIARYRPRFIIEPHMVDGHLTSVEMTAFLNELGYTCAIIDQLGTTLPLMTASPNN